MKNGVLVVQAKRQQGIVQRLLIKKPGFLWMMKISEDTTAYRLKVYEEVLEDIRFSIEDKVNFQQMDWYEDQPEHNLFLM